MSEIYYIDSATGSDGNAGTSADTAFKSLAALNNLTLNPGDTVLLARGTSYDGQLTVKYSGTSDSPITFGAYGQGAAPVVGSGASTGVYSAGTHDVVVHDIGVANTSGYAVFGDGVSNWTVDNVAVSNTGSSSHSGAISFENSSNVTIENSTITGVTGDGMFVNGGSGIAIENNTVDTVQGSTGDNVQVNAATDVTVTGNHLDMSSETDSTKGNLVVNNSDHVDIEDNSMVGGKYGASVNSDNVTIANNDIHGQGGYSWSFGIGIGESWDVSNYDIHGNTIHDVAYGVAITGTTSDVERNNIDVDDNTFYRIDNAALKVDRPASGEFMHNEIATDTDPTRIATSVSAAGTFTVGENSSFNDTPPAVHNDLAQLSSNQPQTSGDLLDNDVSYSGGTLTVSTVDGQPVGDGVSIAGAYGVVSIDADGNFIYRVDPAALANVTQPVSDTFSYVVTDGYSESIAKLEVDLAPGSHTAPVAVNDAATVGSDGTASGDVLTNDEHDAGDTLYVRSVGGTHIGATPVELAGQYGTLTIASDGTFSYAVNASEVGDSDAMLRDTFMYKMSDGSAQDSASLSIWIDPHALAV